MEGRAAAALAGVPKPFFSTVVVFPSPQMTGTKRTPRRRSSVRNLSAFCMAKATVSFFPAKMTWKRNTIQNIDFHNRKDDKQAAAKWEELFQNCSKLKKLTRLKTCVELRGMQNGSHRIIQIFLLTRVTLYMIPLFECLKTSAQCQVPRLGEKQNSES